MKCAVLIPVFNNAGSVRGVIEAVRAALEGAGEETTMVVVDDGSTDGTAGVLKDLAGLSVVTHAKNQGKGAALKTGFLRARDQGCKHVITVDADGQHEAQDVVRVLAAARAHPAELIIGERNMEACAAVPAASKRGRNAARFWLRVVTGRNVTDSQCGLRVYPLAAVLAVPQRFRRYDFETEILARLSWSGVTIRTVPVACVYFPPEKRVTHFRPVVDTVRGVKVNAFLIARRLLPWGFPVVAGAQARTAGPAFGKWWKLETWVQGVRACLREGSSNTELATAFALGIFVGLTPFFMLQTILTLYLARRLHLNMLAALIGSHISIPPLMPLWAGLSYAVGQWLLNGTWGFSHVQWSWKIFWPMLLGSVPVGVVLAMAGFVGARAVLYCVRSAKPRRVAALEVE